MIEGAIAMSDAVTATRAQIQIGSTAVDGFMLPDGSYRMSLSQVAESVDLTARNAFDFLKTKALKRLLGEDYTVTIYAPRFLQDKTCKNP